ncbi:hypothetical protein Ssi03_31240 [Sphaerisporangium siamense]|nr:hypothetical protein Ssi03_31240 [Sphaerisporangium siamense]
MSFKYRNFALWGLVSLPLTFEGQAPAESPRDTVARGRRRANAGTRAGSSTARAGSGKPAEGTARETPARRGGRQVARKGSKEGTARARMRPPADCMVQEVR